MWDMSRRGLAGGCTAFATLLFATSIATADGPARLLKDINLAPSSERSSNPDKFQRLGDLVLFRAYTHGTGYELWKSDGTSTGTTLVKDIAAGVQSSLLWNSTMARPFVVLGGRVLFPADDGVHGLELWTSDGTTDGTRMVKDIAPGGRGGLNNVGAYEFGEVIWLNTVSGGAMYFLADDAVHGIELWRTDGTEAGTWLVKDIEEGPASAYGSPDFLSLDSATVGPYLYFRATTSFYGAELWRTDGTEANTTLVKDINLGPGSSYPSGLTELHGKLVFAAAGHDFDSELWTSDGTVFGTVLLDDIIPGPFGSSPTNLRKIGDLIFFNTYQVLYRTDGTYSGTILLHAFNSGLIEFGGELNGRLFFRADDGVHGYEPWISDGTMTGTTLVKDINPGTADSWYYDFIHVGGVAYVLADDGVHGKEVWRSDGTPDGTRLVADLTPGADSTYVVSAVAWQGGVLFDGLSGIGYSLFRIEPGQDGVTRVHGVSSSTGFGALDHEVLLGSDDGLHGFELWSTDGTEAGTGMLKDLSPILRNESSSPTYLGTLSTSVTPRALFSASDEQGLALWLTDGTSQGTTLVKRVFGRTNPLVESVLNGTLYFLGGDRQLWRTDGTTDGTRLVKEVDPNSFGLLDTPAVVQGRVVFSYDDAEHGGELWASDGSAAGTALLSDIFPGPDGSYPHSFVGAGDLLYFEAYDPDHGQQLWRTDGTQAGTFLVKDFSALGGTCCSQTIPFRGKLIFLPWDQVHGAEPWVTDGTEAGTTLLREFHPGQASSSIREFVVAGDFGYFGQDDGTHGNELWRTDGTPAGTTLVKDILPGAASSFPSFLGAIGETVLFKVRDPITLGWEIWKSDGTDAGTVKVVGGFKNDAFSGVSVGSTILFGDSDDEHGRELWRTDGTAEGTVLVQDIAPGRDDSVPVGFVQLGSRLLFRADDPTANVELFVGRTAILSGRADQGVRDLADEVKGFRLPKGVGPSLVAKLGDASAALAAGNTTAAILALETFVKHVDVQTPRKIDDATAGELIDFAQDLVRMLEGAFDTTQPSAERRQAAQQRPAD
jgi:ELWxxDGT repeat protein